MDNAVVNGLGDVFQNAEHLYCTQHVQEADVRHLQEMGANQKTIKRIMSDMHGAQVGIVEEFGLAEADDEADFDIKFESLKVIWDSLIPFLFSKNRESIFKNNLIQTSHTRLNISGRYYSNGLESHHRLIKKELSESGSPRTLEEVNQVLYKRIEKFYVETERAVRGVGEYRLAQGYEQFFVPLAKWTQWSSVRRQQHMEAFFEFSPKAINQYKKSASAGHKTQPTRKKRKSEQAEAEFQVYRLQANETLVVPSSSFSTTPSSINPLDPDRPVGQGCYLVHRNDKKNCPSKTKRCHACKRLFSDTDWVVVKTEGQREYTNPQGKIIKSKGNVYIHYLSGCLSEFKQNFNYSSILVLKSTLDLLPEGSAQTLKDKGLKFE